MSDAATPDLTELLRRILESRLSDVHVSMAAEIVSYDATTRRAVVRPGVKRVLFDSDNDRVVETLTDLPNVPVVWPGSGSLDMHGSLVSGDTGHLVFSSASDAEWLATGAPAEPGNLRLHSLGYAKFYPGLRHNKNTPADADDSIGVPDGLRARFAADAVTISTDPSGALAQGAVLEDLLKTMLATVLTAGASAGGPGAANFTAAGTALSSYSAPLSGKLRVEP